MAMIVLNSVSKSYKGSAAVQDFSLQIPAGQRVALVGPSGCGKTTVLRLLAGFIAPDAGSICIDGERVAADGRILIQPERRNLGMVFQDLALWPHLSVGGNLEFGLNAHGVLRAERQRRVLETLRMVQLESYVRARPGELSGGQQQRVALARALVLQPKVLLMDEPLSNLDPELNQLLRGEIVRLQERLGFTLIYVTHDPEEAAEIGHRRVAMRHGRIDGAAPRTGD
jgi:ABC-type sugar transport system ATPase subunit